VTTCRDNVVGRSFQISGAAAQQPTEPSTSCHRQLMTVGTIKRSLGQWQRNSVLACCAHQQHARVVRDIVERCRETVARNSKACDDVHDVKECTRRRGFSSRYCRQRLPWTDERHLAIATMGASIGRKRAAIRQDELSQPAASRSTKLNYASTCWPA